MVSCTWCRQTRYAPHAGSSCCSPCPWIACVHHARFDDLIEGSGLGRPVRRIASRQKKHDHPLVTYPCPETIASMAYRLIAQETAITEHCALAGGRDSTALLAG